MASAQCVSNVDRASGVRRATATLRAAGFRSGMGTSGPAGASESVVMSSVPLRRCSSGGYGGGCGLFEFVTLGSGGGDHAGLRVDLPSGVGVQKDLAERGHRADMVCCATL